MYFFLCRIGALLSEMYGGNCYTKILYVLDVNMSFENQLLIDHSQKVRHIVNHPVRNTVYLKVEMLIFLLCVCVVYVCACVGEGVCGGGFLSDFIALKVPFHRCLAIFTKLCF